jgi:hypothetical protein
VGSEGASEHARAHQELGAPLKVHEVVLLLLLLRLLTPQGSTRL